MSGLERLSRRVERPANRGTVIEHVVDEGHPAEETCGICVALSLGAAWAEAEAALPEGWWITALTTRGFGDKEWHVTAENAINQSRLSADGYGPTPAAALSALAAKLREEQG